MVSQVITMVYLQRALGIWEEAVRLGESSLVAIKTQLMFPAQFYSAGAY